MASVSKKEKILKTAGKLFMANGFAAVSMDQIAAAAPVSKPTLYAHFKDKRELFAAVIDLRCERALNSIRSGMFVTSDPAKSLIAVAARLLDLLLEKESLQFHRVMVAEGESFPGMAKRFYETGPKRMQALVRDHLISLNENGLLGVADPDLAATVFLGMIKGPLHTRSVLGLGKSVTREQRSALVETAVNIFINGQRPY